MATANELIQYIEDIKIHISNATSVLEDMPEMKGDTSFDWLVDELWGVDAELCCWIGRIKRQEATCSDETKSK